MKKNVEIESNDVGENVLKLLPVVICSVIMIIGVSLMNAKTFDFRPKTGYWNFLSNNRTEPFCGFSDCASWNPSRSLICTIELYA